VAGTVNFGWYSKRFGRKRSIFAYKGRKPSTNPVCVGIVHDPNKNYVMIMLMRRRQTIKQMTMKLHPNII